MVNTLAMANSITEAAFITVPVGVKVCAIAGLDSRLKTALVTVFGGEKVYAPPMLDTVQNVAFIAVAIDQQNDPLATEYVVNKAPLIAIPVGKLVGPLPMFDAAFKVARINLTADGG